MRRLITALAAMATLAGCGNGLPWGHRTDPNAAQVVQSSEPLVAQCRQRFLADLHGVPVTWEGGPTVMRDGDATSIRLEAQPSNPADFHARRYACDFQGGSLVSAAPVQ